MRELVEHFAELFRGRQDAYGTEQGGSERAQLLTAPDHEYLSRIQAHLEGRKPMGVYPMVPNKLYPWTVRWGCIDFDIKSDHHKQFDYETEADAHQAALNAWTVLKAVGLMGHIEVTRSRGRHVWLFSREWVRAEDMRNALLAVCQIGKLPSREVNPKNVGFESAETLGNYVRLPYPGGFSLEYPEAGWFSPTRVVTLNGAWLNLETFVRVAWETRCDESDVRELAALYTPPVEKFIPPSEHVLPSWQWRADQDAYKRMSGLAYTIYSKGPLDGSDRSGTLYKLALQLRKDGKHTFDEVLQLVTEADLAWGKFHRRHDADRYLRQLVEKVW